MVYGPAGSGKSRLTLRWASLLGETALVSREMTPIELSTCLSTCGAKAARIRLAPTVSAAVNALRVGAVRSVVVDSLHRLDSSELEEVRRHLTRGWWWLISHANKRGESKGTTDTPHDCSVVLRVEPGQAPGFARVTVEKTRLGGPSGLADSFALAPMASPKANARDRPGRSR